MSPGAHRNGSSGVCRWTRVAVAGVLAIASTVIPFAAIGPAVRSSDLHKHGNSLSRTRAAQQPRIDEGGSSTREAEEPSDHSSDVLLHAEGLLSGRSSDEGDPKPIASESSLLLQPPRARPSSPQQEEASGAFIDDTQRAEEAEALRPPPSPPPRGSCSGDGLVAAVREMDRRRAPPLLPPEIQFAWAYQNNDAPGVNYSHMAMIEELPPRQESNARYILVWQAASRLAGLPDQHVRASTSEDLLHWSPSWQLDLPQNGSIWAPVLMLDPKAAASSTAAADVQGGSEGGGLQPLRLFYAESRECTRTMPNIPEKVFAPGGNIKAVSSADGLHWGSPKLLYSEREEGFIPKVIANRPVVTRSGRWVLPFWREDPGSADCSIGQEAAQSQLSGTLLSDDGGRSWRLGGDVGSRKSLPPSQIRLLEGAVVSLGGSRILQLFRSTIGFIYSSRSSDAGETWSKPKALTLPNPNSKIHAIRMSTGLLVLGYNHHKKLEDEFGGTRTALWVAVSHDEGETWATAARLEDQAVPRYKFHYPTLLEVTPCSVAVAYTVGHKEHASQGGVRVAVVDLSRWVSKFGQVPPPEQKPPWEAMQDGAEQQQQPKTRPGGSSRSKQQQRHAHEHERGRRGAGAGGARGSSGGGNVVVLGRAAAGSGSRRPFSLR